jgi:C-terminal processing protease CtpA/Prc
MFVALTLALTTWLPFDVVTQMQVSRDGGMNMEIRLHAAAYAAVATEESRVVGEAWKVLDKAYVDKSFGGNDWTSVRRKYVRPNYKNTQEAYTAIREMTALLGDKFTRFLTPAQYATLSSMYTQDAPAAGIGVELNLDPGGTGKVLIVGVAQGSPAAEGGLRRGDVLLRVDDVAVGPGTGATTPDEVAALLRGEDQTQMTVTVSGRDRDRTVTLTRAELTARAVKSRLVTVPVKGAEEEDEEGRVVGVLTVPSFSKNAAGVFVEAARYTLTHTQTHRNTHTNTHTQTHTHTHTHTHKDGTHTHTHTHTKAGYTHTHTHTHKQI